MTVLEKRKRDDPRGRETEQAFLRATEELLGEGASFAELNVTRLAERAGRTRTAFYAHFDDRRDLLVRLVEALGDELLADADAFFAGAATRDEVVRTLTTTLERFAEHATLLRALVEAAGYDEEIARFWDEVVGRFVAATERRLRDAGAPQDRARSDAFTLVWMTERVGYQHVVRSSGLADDQVVAALADAWWRALTAAAS